MNSSPSLNIVIFATFVCIIGTMPQVLCDRQVNLKMILVIMLKRILRRNLMMKISLNIYFEMHFVNCTSNFVRAI